EKSLGGSDYDYATSIQQTKDNGYTVAGYSYSNDGDVTENYGNYDFWIVKLNANGAIVWQKSLGGSNSDWATSIQQTKDNGYIIAGYSYSTDGNVTGHHGSTDNTDCWIVKLNANGAIEWQKSLGGSDYDYANSIQQTSDGGYIIAGSSYSTDGNVTDHHGSTNYNDYWIVKLK
ncbi:MAG: hypothetical protein LBF86_06275, partial [Helicobacteraceae bacterium]|nr:hypothetical protein [Helicobacteraceae bacterium]